MHIRWLLETIERYATEVDDLKYKAANLPEQLAHDARKRELEAEVSEKHRTIRNMKKALNEVVEAND